MAAFTAYFDESDTPQASVVAGVITEVEQLSHFEREWKGLLESEHLDYFHMKEFAHSKGQFEPWNGHEARRRNFLTCLIGILQRRTRISVGVLLDRADYK